MRCAGSIRRVSVAVLPLALLAACGDGTSSAGSTPTTVISFEPVSTISAAPPSTAEATPGPSTAEAQVETAAAAFDFGDLGHDGYCGVTKQVVDATAALVPTATSDVVKSGLAAMKDSLGSLAANGAVPQRPQFAAAVAVLDKASVTIEANGYDVAKTQSQLSVLDPEGALVGAITIVLTQRQAACG